MNSSSETATSAKTKIVATVGPASESVERLEAMIRAGVDVFRLNLAHGHYEWLERIIRKIQQTSARVDRPVALLADLGGPKIRLGQIPGGQIACETGQRFRFVTASAATDSPGELTSTYESLVAELKAGDLVLLADGTVSMSVEDKTADAATCVVVQPGEIRSGGGINLPGVELAVPALTDKDRRDLEWVATQPVDFIGLSFVRRAGDVAELRAELTRLKSDAQIVAKIEKPQALDSIEEIIRASDAIMVARGDLGVEIDVARIAAVQKDIIRRCHAARVPVITATQMLESMRSSRLPTRAEATDVANAILDGSDALMLSAETAIGQYPVESAAMMSRIALQTERLLQPRLAQPAAPSDQSDIPAVTESLVEAASRLADRISARLVVVATHTGRTARVLSRHRIQTPILGISDRLETVRRMCLYWGVTPLHAPHFRDSAELIQHVTEHARNRNMLAAGDRVVLIASTGWTSTRHDMIVVHVAS
jgi:pyruvate kinase